MDDHAARCATALWRNGGANVENYLARRPGVWIKKRSESFRGESGVKAGRSRGSGNAAVVMGAACDIGRRYAKSVLLSRSRDTVVAPRTLGRCPYQRALDIDAFAAVDENFDEGEGEVHGGAGSARRRDDAVPHHGVIAILPAGALGGAARAGKTGGAPALQQAGVRQHFGRGADRGEMFV